MAKWIAQTVVSSVTPATRRRTAYLAPLADRVRTVIREYLTRNPDAEDVTLEVLTKLAGELKALQKSHGTTRANQDVGLFVAQTLVDLYGAERVWTLRADDGQAVSTRRNTRPELTGVERFTPHRVRLEGRSRESRILLDTIVVNNILRQHPDAMDVQELKKRAGSHRISLANGAFTEIARGLATRKLPVDLWARRIGVLDDILDTELPVAPGGAELAALIDLRSPRGFDVEGMRAYYRGVWNHLRSRRTAADLARPGYYADLSGRQFEVKLDAAHIESVFEDIGRRWASWVQAAGAELARLLRGGDNLAEDDVRRLIRVFLGLDMTSAGLDKIDLGVRAIAVRTREAAVNGYRPTEPNDALDFDLLLAVAMPAVVCTHDARLIRLAERTGSADAWRVMDPPALFNWLAKEQGEPALDQATEPQDALSPEEQKEAWAAWVERGPQGPIEEEALGWP